MNQFLQDARLKISAIVAAHAEPELEIRVSVGNRAKFLGYLTALERGTEKASAFAFMQRCDIHYGAPALPARGPSNQCRIEFRGKTKGAIGFMRKEQVLVATEQNTTEESRRFVLSSETLLATEALPAVLDQCFLKTRCMHNFAHWRVEFVATHKVPVLTQEQIVASRNIYFANEISSLSKFVEFVSKPEFVFDQFAIEYELLPEACRALTSLDAIVPILDEFAMIDRIIFSQDRDAIQYRSVLREAAAYFPRVMANGPGAKRNALPSTIKNATLQAKTMTCREFMAEFPFTDWFVTEKTDGTHALIYAAPNGAVWLLSDKLEQLRIPPIGGDQSPVTIVDGELIAPADGTKSPPLFVIFDVLVIDDTPVHGQPFSERVKYVEEARKILEAAATDSAVRFSPKEFTQLADYAVKPTAYREQIRAAHMLARSRPYKTDGLIFIRSGAPYWQTQILKWKPSSSVTIDFLAKRVPENLRATAPFYITPGVTQYILYCTIQQAERLLISEPAYVNAQFPMRTFNSVFPTPFQTSLAPNMHLLNLGGTSPPTPVDLDGEVLELAPVWLDQAGREVATAPASGPGILRLGWRLERVRHDRKADVLMNTYFGNYWTQAEENLLTFVYPLTIENLCGDTQMYFETVKEDWYRGMTAFNNHVKRLLFERYVTDVAAHLDLAGGRGSDIMNYINYVRGRVFVVERDTNAIQELIYRKHSTLRSGPKNAPQSGRSQRREYPGILIVQQDLTRPAMETVAKLEVMGAPRGAASASTTAKSAKSRLAFDSATCFFAIHYLTATEADMGNFVSLVAASLKPGGHFVFTVFDQRKVEALLAGEAARGRNAWVVEEEGRKKYHIEKVTTSELQPKVRLLLPFTGGELIEEYLINIERLIECFAAKNFTVVERFGFDEKFTDTEHYAGVLRNLTPGDRTFISLYMAVVVKAPGA